ncbi:uncharacterized protein TrAtP1_007942 [Trichoderma atroviride]|uniref:uncharacterized protein n=1 Tax=Hypocrea atroviridis TaxID=63577 RepID=UPI00331906AF|nr:hypothetical protein TrAtP1_007942 [Trichoderma atroviride]
MVAASITGRERDVMEAGRRCDAWKLGIASVYKAPTTTNPRVQNRKCNVGASKASLESQESLRCFVIRPRRFR